MPELDPKPQPLNLAAYGWLDGTDDASPPATAPGQAAHLMLAWERTGHLDRRYVFFVHLLDMRDRGADGSPRIITQSGHEAGDGQFPTTFWETWTNPGIVLDEQILNIPPKTPAGQYQAWGGVYDHDSGRARGRGSRWAGHGVHRECERRIPGGAAELKASTLHIRSSEVGRRRGGPGPQAEPRQQVCKLIGRGGALEKGHPNPESAGEACRCIG